MTKKRHIIVSVTNDLCTDQRVAKVCQFLVNQGFEVELVGRLLPNSWKMDVGYTTKRFRLLFNKGPLFYINYSIRLFFYLLFSKKAILLANDLDTLLPNYLVSKLKGSPIVYDSHEYFTEVPELIHRPKIQKIWESIEQTILPRIKSCYTVSESIAKAYQEKYAVDFKVVRNLPTQKTKDIPPRNSTIIYQGALNIGRGLEALITAMKNVNGSLIIAGSGDIEDKLKKQIRDLDLESKITFLGRLDSKALTEITKTAKIGVSLEEELGLNYTFALPNKLFDYIQARVPVLVYQLPEMKKIVKDYAVGEVLESHDPNVLAAKLNEMLISDQYETWIENCDKAAKILNWEKEQEVLKTIFDSI
jgi:glycosyltransferase involved in cell wall biosynthesis